MFLLFDQNYNVEAYARQQAKETGIRCMTETCKNLGASIEKAINMVAKEFNFSKDEATKYVHEFWKEEN